MNQEIKLLYEDDDKFTITWDKLDNAKYILLGMNEYSSYELIDRVDTNIYTLDKKLLNRYYNFKVDYVYNTNGKDSYLGSSKYFYLDVNEYKNLNVRAIDSYYGITLSIDNTEIYDKFIIYKKNNNTFEMLFETEDFLFNSELFELNSTYYIEAYKKENDEYKLKAKTDEFKIKIEKITKSSNNITISVVVPCYNCELYVSRCIDSILLSTQKDIEIILVNDCSTDRTIGILRWYRDKYKDIVTLIDSEINEGVSITRNKGKAKARGEFTAFVDSDDYVHSRMYENLYNLAKKENLDICIGKAIIRDQLDKYRVYLNVPNKESDSLIYTYEDMSLNQYNDNNIYFAHTCNKIVKTDLIKKYDFPKIRWYEDIAYARVLYSYINKFGYNHNSYYVWDKRNNAIVTTLSSAIDKGKVENSFDIYFKSFDHIFEYCNKDRVEYLIYDCMYDIWSYCGNKNIEENYPEIFNKYIDYAIKMSKNYNLLENKLIKNNKEMYKFVSKTLKRNK